MGLKAIKCTSSIYMESNDFYPFEMLPTTSILIYIHKRLTSYMGLTHFFYYFIYWIEVWKGERKDWCDGLDFHWDQTMIIGWKDHLLLLSHKKICSCFSTSNLPLSNRIRLEKQGQNRKENCKAGEGSCNDRCKSGIPRSPVMNPSQIKFLSSVQCLPYEMSLWS